MAPSSKEKALPTHTQMSSPSLPQTASTIQGPASPQNHIHISRTFGSIQRSQFTVDPNLKVPSSLLDTSVLSLNLKLGVVIGSIDADVHVLPIMLPRNLCTICRFYESEGKPIPPCNCCREKNTRLYVGTLIGSIILHIAAPSTGHLDIEVESTFGRICVFIPRTFHGPLNVDSSLGTPRLSSSLRRVSTQISEVGGERRWFVGDLEEWHEKGESGDVAKIGSSFGAVWVGYVGEEEEARRVLGWQWTANALWALLAYVLFRFAWWIFGA